MNTKTTLLLLAAVLTFVPLTARAQFSGGGFPSGGGFGGGGFQGGGGITAKPTWMNNPVSLSVKSVTVQQAVREVLDKAGVKNYTLVLDGAGYVFQEGQLVRQVGANLAQPYANPVTLAMQSVMAEDALKRIADAAGVKFTFRMEDSQLTILMVKTAAGQGTVYTISPKSPLDPAIAQALTQAAKTARDVQMFYAAPNAMRLYSGATLPDTRVKLDVRQGDVRETLQTLLKQANLDYALEDDVPDTPKRSFTFENVPIRTALDVICQSSDIGWRAETHGGKTLVRVGKKYAAKLSYAPAARFNQLFAAPPLRATPKPAR